MLLEWKMNEAEWNFDINHDGNSCSNFYIPVSPLGPCFHLECKSQKATLDSRYEVGVVDVMTNLIENPD